MKRKEAEALVGSRVSAWTSANGCYVGTLIEVYGSPWRGKVRITGTTKVAVPFEAGRATQRRGFREGDVIEVGGSNVKPTDEEGVTYLQALRGELAVYEGYLARLASGKMRESDRWWVQRGFEEISKQIERENQR